MSLVAEFGVTGRVGYYTWTEGFEGWTDASGWHTVEVGDLLIAVTDEDMTMLPPSGWTVYSPRLMCWEVDGIRLHTFEFDQPTKIEVYVVRQS